MAALVIPNSALFTIQWSGETRVWNNVLGLTGMPTLPVVDQTLANGLHSDVTSALSGSALTSVLAGSTIFERIKVRDISAPNRFEFTSTGTPIAGGDLGDPLPLNVAAVATIRTALAGRRFRGRVYFAGFSEAQNTATGRQSANVNSAIASFLGTLNGLVQARGLTISVLGRPRDQRTIPERIIPSLPGIATQATGFVTRDTRWESQRRRTGRE